MRFGIAPFLVPVLVAAPSADAEWETVRAVFRRTGGEAVAVLDVRAALGRRLFFDKALSRHRDRSCASCHRPELAWTDGFSRARSRDGRPLSRKTPTLIDVAASPFFFWDGRARSLEAQVLMPLENPDEMDTPVGAAVEALEANREYRDAFRAAFGAPASASTVAAALADFVRTIESRTLGESPFDRWLNGDGRALGPAQRRGLALFVGKAQCHVCHRGPRLTTDAFHFLGLAGDDRGLGAVKNDPLLDGMFKVPTLRFVAARPPYMHDGSLPTLRAVVDFYDRGGDRADNGHGLPAAIAPLRLDEREKRDLVLFLQSLGGRSK